MCPLKLGKKLLQPVAVEPEEHVQYLLARLHQSTVFQDAEVVREGWVGQGKALRDLSATYLLSLEHHPHNLIPSLVRQGLEYCYGVFVKLLAVHDFTISNNIELLTP